MICENSRSVLSNMLEDIKRAWFVTLIVVQCVFMIFYSYSIYANIDRLVFLITYSILFVLSIISFVLFLLKHKKNVKQNKDLVRGKNFLKYFVNATMLIVNIIELTKFGCSDFSKILLVISGISLLVQVIIEFIKMFAERYIKYFTLALKKDFAIIDYLNPKKLGSNALKVLDAPIEFVARKIKGEEKTLTKEERVLEDYKEKFKQKQEEKKERKALEKIEKAAETKKQEYIARKKEWNEIKDHFSTVFRRGKKDSKQEDK